MINTSRKTTSLCLLFILYFFPQISNAQHYHEQCATVYADSVLKAKYNYLPSKKEFENWLAPKVINTKNQRNTSSRFSGGDVYTLPVVVHVIHNGDAVGTNENISQAQVYSQIDVLNEDFRRLNPDTGNAPANFQAVASDVGIEFCLAQVDPNGNVLAEPGINRVNAGQATWGSTNDIDNNLKPATVWDPDRYFNIWVVNFGNNGLLGYAQFPSASGLGGMPGNGGPANTDGIVCYYRGFGTVGNVSAPSNGGRTATHEVGHWLGLRHIWGDGGCGVDDFCADTPESDASNRGCPNTSSCGSQDMVQNYMDYTNDACMNIFTDDQVARMRAVMLNSPRRGILNNSTVCQVLDQYTLSGQVRDAGTLNGIAGASVLISSGSFDYTATTDAQGNFSLDVFEGTYDIYAGKWGFVTNVNSNVDVLANTGPVYVDLETGWYDDFIFNFNWTESGDASTGKWERGAPIGTFFNGEPSNPGSDVANDFGDKAYVTGNGGGNAGTDDIDDGTTILTSPVFDLSNYTEPFISYYRWFYNAGGTGTPNDSLIVRISNGIDTEVVEILDVNSPNSNEWNFNQFRVNDYLAPTANMQISFEAFDKPSVGHLVEAGVDLFRAIDSVINQNVPPVANFNANPRTICSGESVNFNDLSSNQPDDWDWIFPGAATPNSTQQNPVVTYNSPGTYDVYLIASNQYGIDTTIKNNFITVQGVEADFSADVQNGCAGITVTFTDQSNCNATSWDWTFPGGNPATSTQQNPVVTYSNQGDYDVSLTVSDGNSNDTKTETDFISIGTGPVNVFFEDFESDDFNTNNWTIENADNAIGWEIYTVGGTQAGDKAAGMNFYNYQNAQGAEDGLITPVLNLSNVINTELSFDHAFRRYSQNEQDSLKILVSTDGGATYPNTVFARAETGTGTFATNTTTTAEFFPNANEDWCFGGNIGATCFTVDLSAFDQSNNIRIKFLAINDFGNNLFLDNIDISGECTATNQNPIADFTSNTTEICEGASVNFSDQSQNNPDTWAWTFAGGNPSTSSGPNPSVTYNNAGVYAVELTVSNPDGSNTKIVNGYITVNENPSATITGDAPTCFGTSDGSLSVNANGGNAPYTFDWSTGASGNSLTGLAQGTYTVTVTDDNNCTSTDAYTLNAPDSLDLNVSSTNTYCGNINGSASVQVAGGTAPYYYEWNTGATTAAIDNIAAGNYSLTVTDDNNCSQSANVDIQDIQVNLNLDLTVTPLTCNNGNDAEISLIVSGGAAPYHYNWNTGDTTSTIDNLGAGAYAVTVRDTNFCTADTSLTISNPAGFSVSEQLTDASCGNSDGSISLSVSGGNAPFTFDWNNGASGDNISGLASGNYAVTITDANSCSENFTYSINNIGGPSLQISIDSISCNGASDGSITINASGGTAPYTYNWNTGSQNDSIGNLSAGIYEVTVTDANGCNRIRSIELSNPAGINALANISSSACNIDNGSIDLNISGGSPGYQVNWSNGLNGANISGLSAGNYTASITDAENCVYLDSFTVNNTNAPSVQLTIVNADCNGTASGAASINASGNGPFQFDWSNGNSNPINSNLSAGNYSYTLTDVDGCSASGSFDITEPDALQISANITDASCAQNDGQISTTVSGGTQPYTYLWSTGQVSNTVNNLSAGPYSFTVTDAKGCNKIRNYNVNNTGGANITLAASHVSCAGAADGSINLSLNGGTAPYTFNWSNGSSSQNISGLTRGSYSVTVTDADGCITASSAILRSPDSLSANYNISAVPCGQKLGEVVPVVDGGTGPFDFLWANGSRDSILLEVEGDYTLSIVDANGCVFLDTVTIPTQNLIVDISIAPDSGQSSGSIQVNVNGGTPPYTYDWQDSSITADDFVDGLDAGTYTLILRDSLACDTIFDIQVPLYSSIDLLASELNMKIYPNPNHGDFVLSMESLKEPLRFELFNVLGKQIDRGEIEAGTSLHQFNYQDVSAGIYFLRLYNEELEQIEKILIRED